MFSEASTDNKLTGKFFFRFFILMVLSVFTCTELSAQWNYEINGTVTKGGKKLEGAIVTVYKGSTQLQQVTTTSNGKFDIKLDPNADYTLTVTKPGFITKKFLFSTRGVPEDVAKDFEGGTKPEISIFEMPKDPTVVTQINSILSQPMAKFSYDDNVKDIVYDKSYSQSMLAALDKLSQIEKEANKKAEEDAKQKQAQESVAASQYQAAIAKGDAAFAKKDYTTARAAYTDALSVKPGEPYPKGKIEEIEKLLADAAKNAQVDADYKAAIAKADAALAAKNYDVAKGGYNDALRLKPAETYPKGKLSEIDAALAKLAADKELNAKYDAAITKGDQAFGAKNWEAARTAYNEALGLKAAEKYPKDKLAEIDKVIADLAAKDKAEKELNAKYTAAVAKGDQAFGTKDYAAAKAGYTEASGLKPSEAYPKTKLAEIDKLLGDIAAKEKAEKELNEKYTAAVAKGDKALASKDYAAAKAGYGEASGLKPSEQYPKDKIAEVDKILADLAAKDKEEKERLAKEKELNDKYNAAIAKGDAAMSSKNLVAAKAGYTEASGLKPAEQYPKDKLAEIEKLNAEAAKQAETDARYKAAITKADAAMKLKTYEAARTAYNEALGLKSSEQYPKDKLAEIDNLLAKDAAAKELNEKYTAALAKADAALAAKSWETAKSGYNEALALKPAEAYPKAKLAEIDKALADIAAKEKAEADKLAKQKELEEKFAAAIKKGDAALAAKDYASAKGSYNEALVLKPAEQYPKDKIKSIDDILNAELGAKQLDEKYKSALAKGDAALAKQDYTNARAAYTEASGVKPSEQYPKDKLAEIAKAMDAAAAEKDRLAKEKELDAKYKTAVAKGDAALLKKDYTAAKAGYNEALSIKAAEQYPKDKLVEIDALIAKEMGAKELNDKYNAAIAKGDKAMTAKDYAGAKDGYNEALALKPSEAYPKNKLAEIEKALADAAAKEKAEQDRLAKEKEIAEKYQAAITKADAALASKDYESAKTSYSEASGLKPAEKYPKDKLTEINAIIAKEMGAKELEKKYTDAIAKADAALGAKDYQSARTQYNAAIALKPAEQYPKDKLAEVDKALADIAAAQQKDAAAKALEAKYQAAIAKGDAAMKTATYAAAKAAYTEASGIKPDEQYPKDKLAEIEKAIADASSQKEKQAIEARYTAAIAKADAALKLKNYEPAKAAYNEALGIKGDEQYPKDKIAEIEKTLADIANKNASQKEIDAKYQSAIAKADAALAAKDYENAKAGYNEALAAKPSEKYPKDKLAAIDALIAKDAGAKQLEEKYQAAIAKGDAAFAASDAEAAKAAYNEALTLKPAEQYPKGQLAKINAMLADMAKEKAARVKYDAAIAKADKALSAADYTGALAGYSEAQKLRPSEPYPANKIAEVNSMLSDLARAKEKEKQYADMIAKADKYFAAKDYKAAKSSYLDAALVKPAEKYPKDKVTECDGFLKKKGDNTGTTTTTASNNKDQFRSELAKKYPEGITEESATENNAQVIRRIVVHGDEGHLYVKKITSFGPIYYFRDDVPITEAEFIKDTEVESQ